jgi:hypothetical protein
MKSLVGLDLGIYANPKSAKSAKTKPRALLA